MHALRGRTLASARPDPTSHPRTTGIHESHRLEHRGYERSMRERSERRVRGGPVETDAKPRPPTRHARAAKALARGPALRETGQELRAPR